MNNSRGLTRTSVPLKNMTKTLVSLTMNALSRRFLHTAGFLGMLCLSATSHAVVTTFNTGLDGWNQTSGISWQSSAGNPGGYARFTDPFNGPGNGGQMVAPNTFHGNWLTQYGATGIFSIDYRVFTPGTNTPFDMWVVITGSGGKIANSLPGNYSTAFNWTTFSRSLAEVNWDVQSGSWAGALSDVTELRVFMAAASSSDEITGVDNIRVAAPSAFGPAAVPEPGTLLLVAGGLVALWRRMRPSELTT